MSEDYGLSIGDDVTEMNMPLIIKELVGDSNIKPEIIEKLKNDLKEYTEGDLLWNGFEAIGGGSFIYTCYDDVLINVDFDTEPYFSVNYIPGHDEDEEDEDDVYEKKEVIQDFNTLEECMDFISSFE